MLIAPPPHARARRHRHAAVTALAFLFLTGAGCVETPMIPAEEVVAGFRWHYSGYSQVVKAQADAACRDRFVLVGLSGSPGHLPSFRFDSEPLSHIFASTGLQELGESFITCLVRVPEGHPLLERYSVVRPGFLILSPAGEKWGAIPLFPQDPERSLRDATAYLYRARVAAAPLPADTRQPLPLELDVPGRFQVAELARGSPGEIAGFQVGDTLRRVNGHEVSMYLDVERLLDYFAGEREVRCEVERSGQRLELRCPPRSNGILLDFFSTEPAAPAAGNAAATPATPAPEAPPPPAPETQPATVAPPPQAPAPEPVAPPPQPVPDAPPPATQPETPPPPAPPPETPPRANSSNGGRAVSRG